jgi:hypothetical protein
MNKLLFKRSNATQWRQLFIGAIAALPLSANPLAAQASIFEAQPTVIIELTAFADVNGDGKADLCQLEIRPSTKIISCRLTTDSGFGNGNTFSSIPGIDGGYRGLPRAFVDVNGDKKADFCRFVRGETSSFLACNLAEANGFGANQYQYQSLPGIDLGYSDAPRSFADVNGDGKADFCRVVGDANRLLACNLAGVNGFGANQYQYQSVLGIDLGYSDAPRSFADVNGDRRADFCRVVGDARFLACNLAGVNSFGANQYQFRSISGIDLGYSDAPRSFADVNGDRRADFCRVVGDARFLACNLAGTNSFGANQYQFRSISGIDLGYADALRGFVDANGDSRADFCRTVGLNRNIRCQLANSNGFTPEEF